MATTPTAFLEGWVKALRSGQYRQQQYRGERSRKDGEFSAIDVAMAALDRPWCGYMKYIVEWFGKESVTKIISMDDVEGKSFSEIADWIDENRSLKMLFTERYGDDMVDAPPLARRHSLVDDDTWEHCSS